MSCIKYGFVSGPLTSGGDRISNIRKAVKAGASLLEAGFVPYVPHMHDAWELVDPMPYEAWMRLCFKWIEKCDFVLRLDGHSTGADREVRYAKDLGKPVFTSVAEALHWFTTSQKNEGTKTKTP